MAHDASDPPLTQDADPQDRRAGRAVFGAFDTTMVLVLGLVCVRLLVAFDRSAEAARLVQLLRRLAPRRFDVLVRRLIERGREEAAAAGDAEQGGDAVGADAGCVGEREFLRLVRCAGAQDVGPGMRRDDGGVGRPWVVGTALAALGRGHLRHGRPVATRGPPFGFALAA